MLRHGSLLIFDLVREKVAPERRELIEPLRARLQQLQHRFQPGAPALPKPLVPAPRRLEPRPHLLDELARREPHQVLLIHPIELLAVENGAAAADAVEIEDLRELPD